MASPGKVQPRVPLLLAARTLQIYRYAFYFLEAWRGGGRGGGLRRAAWTGSRLKLMCQWHGGHVDGPGRGRRRCRAWCGIVTTPPPATALCSCQVVYVCVVCCCHTHGSDVQVITSASRGRVCPSIGASRWAGWGRPCAVFPGLKVSSGLLQSASCHCSM